MQYNFEFFSKIADSIKSRLNGFEPEIGIILGSGLSHFSERIENPIEIKYQDIPDFLVSTAPGHQGKFIFGEVSGRKLMCMSGRFHSYEGYAYEQLTLPIRVMKLCGVKEVILTNAAGAINESYQVGDIMIIKDHIKLNGDSPLKGPNIEEFGERFFDVQDMYSKQLRKIALECAENSSLNFHEGVYFFFTGPQYETPAEIRAARILGGDAAGMSTVTEALTAAHCKMPVLGLSVMTNMAAGVLDIPLTTEEVIETGERIAPMFEAYVADLLRRMP
ncbi:MAG: purine-nucleoside phosphorylase [Clostridia bacterium]|nr:purine-nucleoside phosphorylase [Clostridia bacterium]